MINGIKPNYDMAIEVGEGIYWVGYNLRTIFHTNPYLVVDGDEAVLIDPGSSLDFFRRPRQSRSSRSALKNPPYCSSSPGSRPLRLHEAV